jgi:hypothetical protein
MLRACRGVVTDAKAAAAVVSKPLRGMDPKASGSRGNAYMLLYRRRAASSAASDGPVDAAEEIVREVAVENAAFDRLSAANALRQKLVELEVYSSAVKAPPPAEVTPAASQPSTDAPAAEPASSGSVEASPALRSIVMDVPRSLTLTQATDMVGCLSCRHCRLLSACV